MFDVKLTLIKEPLTSWCLCHWRWYSGSDNRRQLNRTDSPACTVWFRGPAVMIGLWGSLAKYKIQQNIFKNARYR